MHVEMDKMPMSVCMFSNLYPPVVSGSSEQAASLSRELARRGCHTVVITAKVFSNTKEYEEIDGVYVYRLPAIVMPRMPIWLNFPWFSHTFTPRNFRRIQDIIERHKPEILHLHNHMFDLALSAALIRRRISKPLVITIHTIVKHHRRLYNLFLCPADRLLLRHLIINQADALICPDVNIMEYVNSAFGKSDVDLVPYGISLPKIFLDKEVKHLRRKYQLDGHRVILSLGHLHQIRNRKTLIEALPMVHKVFPNTVLFVVGTIADPSAAILARKLGVHESVIFTNHVPHSEVPAFFALSDIEAHWLNQDEPEKTSLGIASLEAMAAGKAILAAANINTHGLGVLRNGENIILVDRDNPGQVAQTIVDLLEDNDRRRAIGDRARHTIQNHFSWETVCAKTLAVYEKAKAKCSCK